MRGFEEFEEFAHAVDRDTFARSQGVAIFLRETVEIHILPNRLPAILRDRDGSRNRTHPAEDNAPSITLTVPARLKRAGIETKLLIDGAGGGPRRKRDHSLHRVLVQAHR